MKAWKFSYRNKRKKSLKMLRMIDQDIDYLRVLKKPRKGRSVHQDIQIGLGLIYV